MIKTQIYGKIIGNKNNVRKMTGEVPKKEPKIDIVLQAQPESPKAVDASKDARAALSDKPA
ncbi:MAG: hypothetical protein AAB953_02375, partial [Patescibacteria group bacterium]